MQFSLLTLLALGGLGVLDGSSACVCGLFGG